jgi:hypothetical protein
MAAFPVEEFELSFSAMRRNYRASCSTFQVPHFHHYPMIRVVLDPLPDTDEVETYIFYLVNQPKKKFFWFALSGIKEEMAKAIAKALEKKI